MGGGGRVVQCGDVDVGAADIVAVLVHDFSSVVDFVAGRFASRRSYVVLMCGHPEFRAVCSPRVGSEPMGSVKLGFL